MIEIFVYTAEDFTLDQAEEVALIAAAQAGDEDAKMRLLRAYGPALRAAVGRFKGGVRDGQTGAARDEHGTPSRSVEDVQSAAIVAFFETIVEHDPDRADRLAGRLVQRLNRALADDATTSAAFAVPERTLSRFYGILRAAEGDVEDALSIVGDHGMSREVFLQVLAAVQSDSVEARLDDGPGEFSGRSREVTFAPVFAEAPVLDVEDRILVDLAFAAVDDESERICRLAFGFTEYDPQPDAEVAHRMGLTRPTVQRKRGKALDTMRKALGVGQDAARA